MTLEIRKTGVVDVRPPLRERARTYALEVRARATIVSRRHAWTVWQLARQVPMTVVLLVVYTPRGLGRVTAAWGRYLRDNDTAELRSHHAGQKETDGYAKASQARAANLHARWMVNGTLLLVVLAVALAWWAPTGFAVLLAGGVFWWTVKLIPGKELWEYGVAAGVALLVFFAAPRLAELVPRPPGWVWWATGVVAVIVLGWLGRPRERQLVTLPESALGGRVPPLTAPMVTAALVALGNSKMKEPDSIKLLSDPHRHGDGMQVELELPPGVPARYVMEHREEFAAALRRELGCVWPSVGRRHPGHLVLFVSAQVMAQAVQASWPLLRPGATVDLFKAFPAFTDQRGEWVHLQLAYASMIIGAIPRMGKTFVLREMLLVAGLDPRAKVYAIDGKGTGDLACCAHFAEFYTRDGHRTDRPERTEEVREVIRRLRRELGRRTDIINDLPHDLAPESKVTSELVDARPDLDLGPIVLGIDETQSYFSYGDKSNKLHKQIREELAADVTELTKLGPAVGIWVVLATQQVNNDTIPTSISNNAVIRFCLKIEGHEPNDRILGTGAYRRGLDAQMLDLEDKGIGYLKAEGATPQIVRSVFGLDSVAAEKLGKRIRGLRIAAGTLKADEDDVVVVENVDLVADVRRVVSERSRYTAHYGELVEWLQDLRPQGYRTLSVEDLPARLRAGGMTTGNVWANSKSDKGIDLRKQGGAWNG